MTTTPSDIPVDPAWNLPDIASPSRPVTGQMFATLLHAAATAPGVLYLSDLEKVFAGGQTRTETRPDGTTRERAIRRTTFRQWLANNKPLAVLLQDAIDTRLSQTIVDLQNAALGIALGGGDTVTDFRPDGSIARVRVDRRNAAYVTLQLLKSLRPDQFGDRKRVTHDGAIQHEHSARLNTVPGITISPDSVHKLPPEKARALLELLSDVMEIERADRILESENREGAGGVQRPQLSGGLGVVEETGGPAPESV